MDSYLSCHLPYKPLRFLSLTTIFIATVTMVCSVFGKPMVQPLPIGFIVQRRNNMTSPTGSETNKSLIEKMSPTSSVMTSGSNMLPNWKPTGATQTYVTPKYNGTETWPHKINPLSAVNPVVFRTSSLQPSMPNRTISISKKTKKLEYFNKSSKEAKIIPHNLSPMHSLNSHGSSLPTPQTDSKKQSQKPHPHLLVTDSNLPYTTPSKIQPTQLPPKLHTVKEKNSSKGKTLKPKIIETTIKTFPFQKPDSPKLIPTSSKPPKISLTPSKAVAISTRVTRPDHNIQWLPTSTAKLLLSTVCAKCTTVKDSKDIGQNKDLQEKKTLQQASTVEAKPKSHIKGKTLKPKKTQSSSTLTTISSWSHTSPSSFALETKSIEKHRKVTKAPNSKSFSFSATPHHHYSLPIPSQSSDLSPDKKTTFLPSPTSSSSSLLPSSPSPSLFSSFTKSTTSHSAVPEQKSTKEPRGRQNPTVAVPSMNSVRTSNGPTSIKLNTPNPPQFNQTTSTSITTTYPKTTISTFTSTPKTTIIITTTPTVTTIFQPTAKPTTTIISTATTTTTQSTTNSHIPSSKNPPRILSTMVVPITTRLTPVILPLHITVHLKMTWFDFCQLKQDFLRDLARFLKKGLQTDVGSDQIILLSPEVAKCGTKKLNLDQRTAIDIKLYLSNIEGVYNPELTRNGFNFIAQGLKTDVRSPFHNWLDKVYLVPGQSRVGNVSPSTDSQKMDTGVAIAIALATIGGLCCLALLVLQIIVHRRRCQKLHMYMPSRKLSLASLDSIALANMSRSRPCSGLYNAGMDPSDHAELSHPLDYQGLKNMCSDVEGIYEEFQLLPNITPKHSDLPMGVEEKNRFIDVLPTPETRVKLKTIPGEENSDYINANFISGPNEEKKAYIATQAPLECTVADFWRMVWEQQGRIIVMLTDMDERGMPKGTPYCPDAEDISSIGLYGDHEVILKTKDFKQEYIASTLELKDMENNLVRKLKHFWYTSWPAHGFPEPISLVKFILDVRLQNEEKLAPLIVHCSSGTGRTGTFVAIDSGIKMFDKSHTVDILNCVYRMRLERPRAVQTKQQYALIYKALLEYASMVVSPSTSSTSSRATGNAVTYTW